MPSKIGNQIILSDEDQDEPTQEDIQEYAKWLGLDPVRDFDLLWIAVEGIKAPLPEGWKPVQSENDELYFFNFNTGESRWDHPLDQHYKDLATKALEEKKMRNEQRSKPRNRASADLIHHDKKKKKKKPDLDKTRGEEDTEELRNFIADSQRENQDLKVQLSNVSKRNQELQLTLNKLHQERSELDNTWITESKRFEAEVNELKKQKEELQNEIVSMGQQKDSIQTSIDSMKKEYESICQDVQTQERKRVELDNQLLEKEQELRSMTNNINQRKEDVERYEKTKTRLRALIKDKEHLSQSFNHYSSLVLSETKSVVDRIKAEYSTHLKTLISKYDQLVEKEKRTFLKNNQEIMKLSQRVKELESSNEDLKKELLKNVSESAASTTSKPPPLSIPSRDSVLNEKWKEQCLDHIQREHASLERAKGFIKQEKSRIKIQQDSLQKARSEWKNDMNNLMTNKENVRSNEADLTEIVGSKKITKNGEKDVTTAPKMSVILKEVKKILEEQAVRLNQEVSQLNRIQQWVKLREEKLKLLKQTVENYSPSDETLQMEAIDDSLPDGSENNQYLSFDNVSPDIIEKLKRIENEIKTIHDIIEGSSQSSAEAKTNQGWKPHSSLSQKWDEILSMYNNSANQVVLRKNKLTGFKDRISQWELDRGIECRVLNNHVQWMKKLYDEMGKPPY